MKLLYTLIFALFASASCTAAMVQYNVPTAAEVFQYPVYFDEATKALQTKQLHEALTKDTIDCDGINKLIAQGADLDWQNEQGQNALMLASQNRLDRRIMKFLIKRTNNLHAKDKNGKTAAHYADKDDAYAIENQIGVNEFFLAALIRKTFASSAHMSEHIKRCSVNINAFSERGFYFNKPLEVAPTWQDTKTLLDNGAKIDREDSFAYFACAIKENKPDIVNAYISQGKADVNSQDNNGNTALIVAASEKQWDCVKALLKAYADPYIKNNDGKTFFDMLKNESWVGIGWERKEIMAYVNPYNFILDRKIVRHPNYKRAARAVLQDTLAKPQILGGASKDLQKIVNEYADVQ